MLWGVGGGNIGCGYAVWGVGVILGGGHAVGVGVIYWVRFILGGG